MVLNGRTIKELMVKNILIKNGNLDNVHSSSYDLTTSKYVLKIKTGNKAISFFDAKKLDSMYEKLNISNGYEFKPGECLLIVLDDYFNMPNNVCACVRGRHHLIGWVYLQLYNILILVIRVSLILQWLIIHLIHIS